MAVSYNKLWKSLIDKGKYATDIGINFIFRFAYNHQRVSILDEIPEIPKSHYYEDTIEPILSLIAFFRGEVHDNYAY
jgi:hypothetical protein